MDEGSAARRVRLGTRKRRCRLGHGLPGLGDRQPPIRPTAPGWEVPAALDWTATKCHIRLLRLVVDLDLPVQVSLLSGRSSPLGCVLPVLHDRTSWGEIGTRDLVLAFADGQLRLAEASLVPSSGWARTVWMYSVNDRSQYVDSGAPRPCDRPGPGGCSGPCQHADFPGVSVL